MVVTLEIFAAPLVVDSLAVGTWDCVGGSRVCDATRNYPR